MSGTPQSKGWCPSAWRPMLTGDGYLVRLHFSCGIVSSEQARVVASLARRYGNGFIDLTRRANLQIRGVAGDGIDQLQRELLAGGLIAQNAQGVETPNVVASPLSGRDRTALIDIRPLVQKLEEGLASAHIIPDLPAKFCILLEDGGRFSLRDIDSDIAFEACHEGPFAVRIGSKERVGFVETGDIADTALALVTAFVTLAKSGSRPARRMRELVVEGRVSAILPSCLALGRAFTTSWSARDDVNGRAKPGYDAVGFIADDILGVAAPFGSLQADQLALIADLADLHAGGELRLTPWRAILMPAIASGTINHIGNECARAGLVTDPSNPRRHVAACSGAPGCVSASVETRNIAEELAPLLRPRDTLHVSACAKSCASSSAASLTLVGREGRFDLIRDGRPGDTPVLVGLSPEGARAAIKGIAAEKRGHV